MPELVTYRAGMSAGQLRAALSDVPDLALVVLDVDSAAPVFAETAYEEASDVYPEPIGTNPVTETTISLFVIEGRR